MKTKRTTSKELNKKLAEMFGVQIEGLQDVQVNSIRGEFAEVTLTYSINYTVGDKIHSDTVGLEGFAVKSFSVSYCQGSATVVATILLFN